MAQITFITTDKHRIVVDGQAGQSLMELAVAADVPGIDADCGGGCSCATCHVYVAPPWNNAVGEPDAMEQSMLDFQSTRTMHSRLSCQISISEALDGLEVVVAEHD